MHLDNLKIMKLKRGRLKNNMKYTVTLHMDVEAKSKNEAIEEFADRVAEGAYNFEAYRIENSNNKEATFEDYLKQVHAAQYEGLDDDMPDDFDHWFTGLEIQELYDYAEAWGKSLS